MKDISKTEQAFHDEILVLKQRIKELEKSELERKLADSVLQERNKQIQETIKTAQAGYFFIDREGVFRQVNDAWLRMHKYDSADEVIGRHFSISQVDIDLNKAKIYVENILNGTQIPHGEFSRRCKDGSIGYHVFSACPVVDCGQVKGLEGFIIDITERKRTEEILHAEKQFSDTVINSLPGVFYLFDESGRLLRWNRNLEKISGYSTEEISTMHPLNFFTGEDKKRVEKAIQEVFTRGQSIVEADFVSKDNRFTSYLFTGTRITVGNAECLTGMGINITDRKRAETALKDSEERYRILSEVTNDMIFIINSDDCVEYVNNVGAEQFGCLPEEIVGMPRTQLFPPEIAAHQKISLQRVFQGGSPLHVEGWTSFPSCDMWHSTWLVPLKDSTGIVKSVLGVARDITTRKLAEIALRESENKYHSVIENIQDVFYRSDTRGALLMGSPSGAKMFGYDSVDEMIGLPLDLLWPDPAGRQQLLDQIKANGSVKDFEAVLKKKNGTTFDASLTTHFYYDDQGNFLGTEGIIRDITEHKRAEEEREKLILELQEALHKVKTLSGLLPICASCKKIRNDKGHWEQMEVYIRDRSEAEFSHGICPECAQKLYPEYYKKK